MFALVGLIVSPVTLARDTVIVEVPLTVPDAPVIVAVPGDTPDTRPFVLTVATLMVSLLHCTSVRLLLEPSL
jgi:hypothetical protein